MEPPTTTLLHFWKPAQKLNPIQQPPRSAEPPCEHIYLRQSLLSSTFPPLYISNPTPPAPINFATTVPRLASHTPPISPLLISQLERVHAHLGPKKHRDPFLARDIDRLQRELEGGMNRSRREQVELYVAGLKDPWRRACTELYLARYPGFVMRGDGRLDFGTRGKEGVGEGYLKKIWGCGIM